MAAMIPLLIRVIRKLVGGALILLGLGLMVSGWMEREAVHAALGLFVVILTITFAGIIDSPE